MISDAGTMFLTLAVASLAALSVLLHRRAKVRGLPGPPHHKILGSLPAIMNIAPAVPRDLHPQALMTAMKRSYGLGDLFFVDIWPLTEQMCVITTPDVTQQLAQVNPLPRHPMVTRFVKPLVGQHSMLISNGQKWKDLRAIFSTGFSNSHLVTLIPLMIDKTLIFCRNLEHLSRGGHVFQMEEVATKLTVDVIGKVVLDIDLDSQSSENELVTAFRKSMTWIPDGQTVNWNPMRLIMQRHYSNIMDDYIRRILRSRVNSKYPEISNSQNLMDLAIEKFEEQRASLTEKSPSVSSDLEKTEDFEQVAIDNLKTFFFAGHDTSSSTIANFYYLLTRNYEALARIRAEHTAILGDNPSAAADLLRTQPGIINRLPYTTAVIKETLRIFPLAGSLRLAKTGTVLKSSASDDPIILKEPTLIWLNTHTLHHDAKYFPDPDEFHPERFLDHPLTLAIDKYSVDIPAGWPPGVFPPKDAYRPFEKGPRHCIGQELAMIELRIVLALTIRTFDFEEAFETWAEKLRDEEGRKWWSLGGWLGKVGIGGGGSARVSGKEEAFGEKAYQVFSATAKPRWGMPMKVRMVNREE